MMNMGELTKTRTMKVNPDNPDSPSPKYLDVSEFGLRNRTFLEPSSSKPETARDEIEKENIAETFAAEERNEIYRDILLNRSDHEIPYRYAFYSLSSILVCVILTAFLTIPPVHNVLDKSGNMSQYWWETLIQTVSYFVACCAYMLLNCSYWTNIGMIRTFKNFGIFFAWTSLISASLFVGVNMYWIYGLQLRYPAPFIGMLLAYVSVNLAFIPLWYTFPKDWRKEKDIRRKYGYFILSIWVNMFITMIYSFYTKVFLVVPKDYQWVAAVTLVPLREFNLWLQKKVCYKSAGVKDTSIALTCGHNINNRHCFFILVVLGTLANDLTSWVILVVASGVNLYLGIRIVWTKHKTGFNGEIVSHAIGMLIELIVNETVEMIVPISYILCFLIAYFGPNAEQIGTVKSAYWHHVPVKDVFLFCQNLGLFLIAEAFTFAFSYILLRFACGINIMRAFAIIQREYWLLMAINTGYTINMYFWTNYVSLGVDQTYQFRWLHPLYGKMEHNVTIFQNVTGDI